MRAESQKTVRQLVLEKPGAARSFEKLGIDYCCGGSKSLAEACEDAHVQLDDAMAALDVPASSTTEPDWQQASLSDLVRHIVEKHHSFTRSESERITALLAKTVSAHSANHPELLQLQALFGELAGELTTHMAKEERVLFPYIIQLEDAATKKLPLPQPMFGTVQNPVRMMMLEHDASGQALRRIRETAHQYAPPPDACVTYQTLYRALEGFEKDLHEHIHLENNILFPRCVEIEQNPG